MKVVYACQELPARGDDNVTPNSIFLAGPTPRSNDVPSWRPEALNFLKDRGFDGYIFVPEGEDGGWGDYAAQVHWEWKALGRAACVLFWVPRDLETMPGFTTNVEYGFMVGLHPERVVLGSPASRTPKMRYLQTLANETRRFHWAFKPDCGRAEPILQGGSLKSCLLLAIVVATPEE